MVASEATPYAKTGGLADVVGSLPAALAARGEQVGVVMPLYRSVQPYVSQADYVYDRMSIWFSHDQRYEVNLRRVIDRGVAIYFVDCPGLYDREYLYGENGEDYPDNHIRFGVLCRAAMGVMRSLFRPDVVHCHDWQGSLTGPFMRHRFRTDPTFSGIRLLLTIHNIGYQGLFPRDALVDLGLSDELFHPDGMEFWGKVNLLKGGIVFADALNTVSRGYAREIQTPEYGFGLEGLLRARSAVLTGILNGVDYNEWSPDVDPYIAAHYNADDLSGKRICKQDLLREFGLASDRLDSPVIGMVSRFVGQKGFDLIEEVAPRLLEQADVCLTALGTGEPRYDEAMLRLAERFPDRAGVRIGYDNSLAHKIEAGADIFLMPSRYEPCGLNQIYSLRYGTVPVVRATGGLDDTIDEDTGFKFRDYSGPALLETLLQAISTYRNSTRWLALARNGMRKDFSWSASAAEYSALYRRIAAD